MLRNSHARRPTGGVAPLGAAAGVIALGAALVVGQHRWHRRLGRVDEHTGDSFGELTGVTHRHIPTSDGGRIHVVDRGSGRPFVLLPGVTLTTVSWQYQMIDLVEAGYRVLALDIRGHGGSIPGRDGYAMSRLADDVRTVLSALDVRDAVVVGHSLGGMTALQLLVDHPELERDGTVSAIALISTSASMVIGNGVPAMLARLGNAITPTAGRGHAYATAGDASRRVRTNLASFYCRLAFGAAPSPTHVEVVRAMTAAVPPAVVSPLIVTLINLDIRPLLAAITVPTLVVVGQRDLVTPFWHSRYLASHIPGSELVVLPGCGHLVPFERHAELSKLLVGWGEAIV